MTSYTIADAGTGLVLNLMMMAAGIGLVRRKSWGVSLGIATAWGKIVRLIALYSYFALAVVPILSQQMGQLVGEMMAQQQQAIGRPMPPGMDTAMLVKIYFITYTITAVAMILLGSIYPAISLWLLYKPAARAACEDAPAPPGQELNESW